VSVSSRCIVRRAAKHSGPPLLFVHGAYVGAWCWERHFLDYFSALGHDCHAISLRGHAEGEAGDDLASIDDFVADVLIAAESLDTPPVLIGHSMGAMVVQRAWRRANAAGFSLLAPVPPQGLLASSAMLALNSPEILNEINGLQINSGCHGSPALLRQAIFSPTLAEAEVLASLSRMRRESQRALIDLSWPQYFWIDKADGRVPVQVLGAADDLLFPPSLVEAAAAIHGVKAEILPGIAHAMMLDTRWRDAAAGIGRWLKSFSG
jgi:pimeloyl-ACP methyl ester carboxylesterase